MAADDGAGQRGDVGQAGHLDGDAGLLVLGAVAVAELGLAVVAPHPDGAILLQRGGDTGGDDGDDIGEAGDFVGELDTVVGVDSADGELAPGEDAALGGAGEDVAVTGADLDDAGDAGNAVDWGGGGGLGIHAAHRGAARAPGANGAIAVDGEGDGAGGGDLDDVTEAGDGYWGFHGAGTTGTAEFAVQAPTHGEDGAGFEEEVGGTGAGGDVDDFAGDGDGDVGGGVAAAVGDGGAGAELAVATVAPAADGAIGEEDEFVGFAGDFGDSWFGLGGGGDGGDEEDERGSAHGVPARILVCILTGTGASGFDRGRFSGSPVSC